MKNCNKYTQRSKYCFVSRNIDVAKLDKVQFCGVPGKILNKLFQKF